MKSFNKAVCGVAKCWVENEERTGLIDSITNYILYAGMYGDMKNRVAVAKAEKGGALRHLWFRIFLPYKKLKCLYPRLGKFPILYPFYQIKRWFRLLKKDNRKKAINELKETTNGDLERQKCIAKLLKELDLKVKNSDL